MKAFDKFERFQLGKSEMNSLKGGYTCIVDWGEGIEQILQGNPALTREQAEKILRETYQGTDVKCE